MMDIRMYSLVHKELTGQLTDDESSELKRLRGDNPKETITHDIATIWSASKEYIPTKDWKKADAKADFMQRIKADAQPKVVVQPTDVKSNLSKYLVLGASILLLSLAAWYFLSNANNATVGEEVLIEYAMLDDNSKLWIGEGSQVKVSNFSDTERNVALEGEAIFDIARDESRPFIIDLGNDVYAEVLGTSFKATSTHDGNVGSIAVREGRVKLYSTTQDGLDMVLNAGEYGSINPTSKASSNTIITKPIVLDLGEDISFQNTPLSEVFESLGRFYGVQIEIDGTVDCPHTSPLVKNSSLNDALAVILTSHSGLAITESERSTYVVSGTCH